MSNTSQDVGHAGRWPTASIRTWLTICGTASLLPLVLVLSYLVSAHYAREKAAAISQLQSTNRALLQVLDRELSAKIDIARIYASAQAIKDKDFARFYEQARNGLASLSSRGAFFLATTDGQIILHTDRPLGAALPSLADAESVRRAIENRQPHFSNYSVSSVSGRAEISVTVAVEINGQPAYALGLTTPVGELSDILKRQQVPDTWLASIVDRNQIVLARTTSPETFVGTRTSTAYSDAIAQRPEGLLDGTMSAEGRSFITVWMRSPQSGWTLGIGADSNDVLGPLYAQMRLAGAAGIIATAVALLVVFLVARRFDTGTAELRAAALAMSAEMPVSPVSTGVREYDQLSNAFADTSSRLRARTAERAEAERTLSGALNNLSELSKFTEKRFRAESLQDIYDAGLDAILNCLGCSRAAILIADEAKVMRFVAWRGLSLPYRVAVEGHSPWQTDEPDPQIVAVPDVDFEAMPEPLRATIKAEGIGALAFIPVVAGDRLVGKLMSYYDQPHDYNDEEKKLSLELARQIGFGVERKRAENTQRMLVRELQHRTNNLLAVIQGIAQRTFSGAYSLEQSRRLFDGRLRALSRAHRKLTNSNWTGVSLEELVRTELEPFANRANVEGIDVVLTPAYAQNFSLALHELTTNAIKHGALSNADGRLDVAWTVGRYGKDGMLNFRWREHGGPPVLVPLRHGFGTSLLSATFAGARLNYNSDGFCCEFDILLDQVASVPPAASLAAIPAIV